MADIKVNTSPQNSLKVSIGQQNATKILSSVSGGLSFSDTAQVAKNVIGGISSVTSLSVSGVSTFLGNVNVGINTSQGLILTAQNGNRYRLIVGNNGELITVHV